VNVNLKPTAHDACFLANWIRIATIGYDADTVSIAVNTMVIQLGIQQENKHCVLQALIVPSFHKFLTYSSLFVLSLSFSLSFAFFFLH